MVEDMIIPDKDGKCSICSGTYVCPSCKGSGEHPEMKGVKCPTCGGSGECPCQTNGVLSKK